MTIDDQPLATTQQEKMTFLFSRLSILSTYFCLIHFIRLIGGEETVLQLEDVMIKQEEAVFFPESSEDDEWASFKVRY